MLATDYYTMFDDYIYMPAFNRADMRAWFKEKGTSKAVYVVFNTQLEPLYVGSSINLKHRLPQHLQQDKLTGHFDDVLFIGVRYYDNDLLSLEKNFIHYLKPKLNKMTYIRHELNTSELHINK